MLPSQPWSGPRPVSDCLPRLNEGTAYVQASDGDGMPFCDYIVTVVTFVVAAQASTWWFLIGITVRNCQAYCTALGIAHWAQRIAISSSC